MDQAAMQWVVALFGAAGGGAVWAALKLASDLLSKHREYKGSKAKPWRDLLASGQWRLAPPYLLESTFLDAHGYALGDREIRFGLERHNSTEYFRYIGRCRAMIKASSDVVSLVHRRGLKFKRWSYRAHGIAAFGLGYVPFVVLAPLATPLTHVLPQVAVGWLFVYAAVWFFVMFLAAQQYEAAHMVTRNPDEDFPRWYPDTERLQDGAPTASAASTVVALAPSQARTSSD